MDVQQIVRELRKEIGRLDQALSILNGAPEAAPEAEPEAKPPKRRRRHLTAAGRAKLSQLMRLRWKLAKKKGHSKLK